MCDVSDNESRWFVRDKEGVEVIADPDPVNEVALVSTEALLRPPLGLCPLLVVLMPLLPVVVVTVAPLTMHPGFEWCPPMPL